MIEDKDERIGALEDEVEALKRELNAAHDETEHYRAKLGKVLDLLRLAEKEAGR